MGMRSDTSFLDKPRDAAADQRRREEFLACHPFDEFYEGLTARLEGSDISPTPTPSPRLWLRWLFVGGAAAALAVIIALIAWPGEPLVGVRLKAGHHIGTLQEGPVGASFHVKHGQGSIPGHDGMVLQQGDAVRFTYSSGPYDYLWVLSVDGSGTVSPFYPAHDQGSMAIVRGTGIPLPGSIILDDYQGFERLFFIFSHEPLTLSDASAPLVEALGGLAEGGGDARGLTCDAVEHECVSFWIEKR